MSFASAHEFYFKYSSFDVAPHRSLDSTFLPLIQTHLILSLLFLLPPLLFSSELPRANKYIHLSSYSTELGFWLQEIGVSGCGLLNLIGFYKLLQVRSPFSFPCLRFQLTLLVSSVIGVRFDQ